MKKGIGYKRGIYEIQERRDVVDIFLYSFINLPGLEINSSLHLSLFCFPNNKPIDNLWWKM